MAEPLLKFTSEVIVKDDDILVIMSNERVDRDDDTVDFRGWELDDFYRAPRLMACHEYGSLLKQIGAWEDVRMDRTYQALVGTPVYFTGKGNPEADWAYELAKLGQATFSVGFQPLEWEPRKGRGQRYTKQALLECSQVPIPSNADALPVERMVKALRSRYARMGQSGRAVQKWAIDDDGMGYGPDTRHCIVAGGDDASQLMIPICSEHLKVLMQADPEPAGSPPDDDAGITMGLHELGRILKAGKPLSGANLGHLHTAMQSLKTVHATAGAHDDCPLADDSTDEPATERDKAVEPPAKAYDLGAVIEAQLSAALEARAW